MGAFMMEWDNQIPYLLDNMNIRFGAPDGVYPDIFGGIFEVAALQKEFGVFKPGRMFGDVINVLGLAGFENPVAHKRWIKLLNKLGNQKEIIDRIIDNLGRNPPVPMYFRAAPFIKDYVATFSTGKPLPYSLGDYLIVDIPMKPRDIKKEKEERDRREMPDKRKS